MPSTVGAAAEFRKIILQETDANLEPLAVAKLLKEVVGKESPELVILGKQAIDGDYNQTGERSFQMHSQPTLFLNNMDSSPPLQNVQGKCWRV